MAFNEQLCISQNVSVTCLASLSQLTDTLAPPSKVCSGKKMSETRRQPLRDSGASAWAISHPMISASRLHANRG